MVCVFSDSKGLVGFDNVGQKLEEVEFLLDSTEAESIPRELYEKYGLEENTISHIPALAGLTISEMDGFFSEALEDELEEIYQYQEEKSKRRPRVQKGKKYKKISVRVPMPPTQRAHSSKRGKRGYSRQESRRTERLARASSRD